MKEFADTRAVDFIKGFWYGNEHVKQFYPEYYVDFERFSIPDEILSALSRFSLRSDHEKIKTVPKEVVAITIEAHLLVLHEVSRLFEVIMPRFVWSV